jgi:hypothetical protein
MIIIYQYASFVHTKSSIIIKKNFYYIKKLISVTNISNQQSTSKHLQFHLTKSPKIEIAQNNLEQNKIGTNLKVKWQPLFTSNPSQNYNSKKLATAYTLYF